MIHFLSRTRFSTLENRAYAEIPRPFWGYFYASFLKRFQAFLKCFVKDEHMQINNYLLLLFVYCLPFPPAKWDILKKGRARARAPHTQDKHLKIFFKNFEKIIAQIHSFSKFKMNIFCENSKGKIIKFQVLDEKIAPNLRH